MKNGNALGMWDIDRRKSVPEQRRDRQRAFDDVEEKPFGWYHIRTILVAGSGFFTDAYDIFSINMGIFKYTAFHLIQ
jgi:MFS transporter, PHS family, inorganic phosphate transporter